MKQVLLILVVFLQGCIASTPSKIYKHPERYKCQLILETEWDSTYPVQTFEQVFQLGEVYKEPYYGMRYKLVPTDDPEKFALKVIID